MDMIAEILGKMNTVVTIISFIVIAIFLFLLYMAYGKIKDLEKAKANLKDDNSKLSDALRRKGIEVNGLLKKIKRWEKK